MSGLFSGTALAASGDDHGKATAPGQVKRADSAAGATSSDAGSTSTTTTTTTSGNDTTMTTATAPAGFIGPLVPADPTVDHSQGTAATTGVATAPQPLSNADLNSGGANNGGNCGAYCSTRDGSASLNGNGGGAANGKPCAGCVGKADNKNPRGQAPNGTDHNNGYECDGNNGVGKSNPAHTGCKPAPVTPPTACQPTEANHHCGTDVPDCKGIVGGNATAADCPKPTPDCLGVIGGHATAAQCAKPISGGGGNPVVAPVVGPPIVGRTVTPPTPVTGVPKKPLTGSPGSPGTGTPPTVTPTLPFTGSNTALLLEISLLMLLTGGGLMLLTRNPRPSRAIR
jgi:hypothetical protein